MSRQRRGIGRNSLYQRCRRLLKFGRSPKFGSFQNIAQNFCAILKLTLWHSSQFGNWVKTSYGVGEKLTLNIGHFKLYLGQDKIVFCKEYLSKPRHYGVKIDSPKNLFSSNTETVHFDFPLDIASQIIRLKMHFFKRNLLQVF